MIVWIFKLKGRNLKTIIRKDKNKKYTNFDKIKGNLKSIIFKGLDSWLSILEEIEVSKHSLTVTDILSQIFQKFSLFIIYLFSATGCPNKHGNSVTNSISSFEIILWFSIVISTEKAVICKSFVCYVHILFVYVFILRRHYRHILQSFTLFIK